MFTARRFGLLASVFCALVGIGVVRFVVGSVAVDGNGKATKAPISDAVLKELTGGGTAVLYCELDPLCSAQFEPCPPPGDCVVGKKCDPALSYGFPESCTADSGLKVCNGGAQQHVVCYYKLLCMCTSTGGVKSCDIQGGAHDGPAECDWITTTKDCSWAVCNIV